MFGLHDGRVGQPLLERRQDLDPLDRIHPQVPVERQRQVQAVHRVTRLLRHHRQQRGRDAVPAGALRHRGRRGFLRGRRKGGRGENRRLRRPDRRTNRSGRGRVHRSRREGVCWSGPGNRAGRKRRGRAEPGEQERLLLIDERLQRPLGRLLRVQELLVQRRRLLLHPLQRGEALLRHRERLGERVGVGRCVGVGHRGTPRPCENRESERCGVRLAVAVRGSQLLKRTRRARGTRRHRVRPAHAHREGGLPLGQRGRAAAAALLPLRQRDRVPAGRQPGQRVP